MRGFGSPREVERRVGSQAAGGGKEASVFSLGGEKKREIKEPATLLSRNEHSFPGHALEGENRYRGKDRVS